MVPKSGIEIIIIIIRHDDVPLDTIPILGYGYSLKRKIEEDHDEYFWMIE